MNPRKKKAREIAKRAMIIWIAVFALVLSSAFDSIDRALAGNHIGTTLSSVMVGNAAPTIAGVVLKKGQAAGTIVVAEGTTITVNVVGIITDNNGDEDISSATATIYRTSIAGAESCSANDANCYIITAGNCTLETTDGDNDRAVTCTTGANFHFFADSTADAR